MKIVRMGFSLVAVYAALGVAVLIAQTVLSRTYEPECHGRVEHRLQQNSTASRVAGWLPALGRDVVRGDMTFREYMLGGYRCNPFPAAGLEGLGLLFGGLPANDSITSIMKKAGGSASTPESGSLATGILDSLASKTVEPTAGITLKIPVDWIEKDNGDLEDRINETMRKSGSPDGVLVREYIPGQETKDWSAKVRIETIGGIRLGGDLLTVEALQDVNNLRRFADVLYATDSKILKDAGYTDIVRTGDAEDRFKGLPSAGYSLQAVDAAKTTWVSRVLVVSTPMRVVDIMLIHKVSPPAPYKEVMERLLDDLHIEY